MARIKTPAAGAAKWQQGVQNGAAAWSAGITAVTDSPMAAAAAQAPKAITNYTRALRPGGPWVTAMANYPIATWKSRCAAAAARGAYGAGAAKGQPKMLAFLTAAQITYMNMRQASQAVGAAGGGPTQKVAAALQVLMDAKGSFR